MGEKKVKTEVDVEAKLKFRGTSCAASTSYNIHLLDPTMYYEYVCTNKVFVL